MPSVRDKAMLVDVQVFFAENNIRRAVFQGAVNVQATDGDAAERSQMLAPNASWTYTSIPNNKGTVVRVKGGPLDVVITTAAGTFSFKVNSLFIWTDPLISLAFTNPVTATESVQVRVIQV